MEFSDTGAHQVLVRLCEAPGEYPYVRANVAQNVGTISVTGSRAERLRIMQRARACERLEMTAFTASIESTFQCPPS